MTLPPKALARVTPSPCVRLCTLNDDDVCIGCGRTLDDIKDWTKMDEPGKAACVERARQRLVAMGRPVQGAMPYRNIGEA